MSKTMPISEVKTRFPELVSGVQEREDEIVVTRNGKPAAVLVNYDEYERLKETLEVLSDPAAMRQIAQSKRFFAKRRQGESFDEKRGRESFHVRFGRPRGCSVPSSPNCFATLIFQSSLPNGRPRCALERRSSSCDARSGWFNDSIQFCGRSIGHGLKNSTSLSSCRATR